MDSRSLSFLPCVLLVEGKDDQNFFTSMLDEMNISNIGVVSMDGKSRLRERLGSLLKSPGFSSTVTALGIIRDADQSRTSEFQSVTDALKAYNLKVPKYDQEIVFSNPSTGVFILADEREQGMLESLLQLTIEDTDRGDCIDRFFECVSRIRHGSEFEKSSKAFIHTYIATTQHPGVSVGVAAQKHIWQWDHPALSSIREFVLRLSRVADRGSSPGGLQG